MTLKAKPSKGNILATILLLLVLLGGVVASVILVGRSQILKSKASSSDKKNVLVFMIDDLDEDSFNLMLSKGKLPNIQSKLLNGGQRFINSFVTNPLCCPSRATYVTGKYSHNSKVQQVIGDEGAYGAFIDRNKLFNTDNVHQNLGPWLSGNGYFNGMIGKFLGGTTVKAADMPGWDFWRMTSGYDTRPGHYIAYDNKGVGTSPNYWEPKYVSETAKKFIDNFLSLRSANTKNNFFLTVAPHSIHQDIRGWTQNAVFPSTTGKIIGFGIFDHPNTQIGRIQTLIVNTGSGYEVWNKGPSAISNWAWVKHPLGANYFDNTDSNPVVEFGSFVTSDGKVRYQVIRGIEQSNYATYSCDLLVTQNPYLEKCSNWVKASGDLWKLQNGDVRPIVGWSTYIQPNGVTRQEIVRGTQLSGYDLYYRLSTDWNTWIKIARGWDYNFNLPSYDPIVSWNSFLENGDKIRHHLVRGSGSSMSNYKFWFTDENSFWGNGKNWSLTAQAEDGKRSKSVAYVGDTISKVLGVAVSPEKLDTSLGIMEEDATSGVGSAVTVQSPNYNPVQSILSSDKAKTYFPPWPYNLRVWADGNWENPQPDQSFNYSGGLPAGSLRLNGDKNSFYANSGFDLPTKQSMNYAVCGSSDPKKNKPLWLCNDWPNLDSPVGDTTGSVTINDYLRRTYLDRLEALIGIDAMVGEVYDYLAAKGLLESTVIMFTSDNGWFAGEFRLSDKSAAFEESVRVPLVVKSSENTATVQKTQLVANIDLAPTILDFAGLDWKSTNYNVDGRSFKQIVQNAVPSWRDVIYLEHRYPRSVPFDRPHKLIPDISAVRSVSGPVIQYPAKYVKYVADPDKVIDGDDTGFIELYNLQNDQNELVNLSKDPVSADLMSKMEAARLVLSACSGEQCRTADIAK